MDKRMLEGCELVILRMWYPSVYVVEKIFHPDPDDCRLWGLSMKDA